MEESKLKCPTSVVVPSGRNQLLNASDLYPTLRSYNGSEKSLVFDKLVNKKQLAEQLEISQSYINKLMAEEGLPYFKLGRSVRFRISEVAEWLSKRRYP